LRPAEVRVRYAEAPADKKHSSGTRHAASAADLPFVPPGNPLKEVCMRANILLIATLGFAAVPALADGNHCSQDTIRGFWAFNCDGHTTEAMVPTRFFGTCDADRGGFFSCEGSYNTGGTVFPVTIEGQADTKKDCTGTITYDEFVDGTPIGQLMIRYTVLDGGDTIWGLPFASVPPSPMVLACNLRRISK
jgi:hypothetical protein